ncbi:MAG: hypothetical protein IT337_17745 [Thermomicrobiales bacterium]|nr:hypothetical protein [Thermomicrobiales bacterium]
MTAIVGIAAALALSLGGVANVATAQEIQSGFPAQIHTGTCESLGEVVHPLGAVHRGVIADVEHGADAVADAVRDVAEKSEALAGKVFDAIKKADQDLRREHPTVLPVELSESTVTAALPDLLSSPHAIVISESADKMETHIACGDITGELPANGRDIAAPLNAESDSGYSGIAWLHENGDKTQVLVFLTQGLPELGETPAGTPTP